ncbi:hypothetical protein DFH11DRAFT_1602068 [Phellopilus nigrolimitatus]|nr:hypothetical protein DFH11DRAFT_1602068 [Phellopilus nigrolimitatus]
MGVSSKHAFPSCPSCQCHSVPSHSVPSMQREDDIHPVFSGWQNTNQHYGAVPISVPSRNLKGFEASSAGSWLRVTIVFTLGFLFGMIVHENTRHGSTEHECTEHGRPRMDPAEELAKEIAKYRAAGMSWDIPQPTTHCHAYGSRMYTASLSFIPASFASGKACKYTPIKIHDQTFEEPDSCVPKGLSDVRGYWLVHEKIECMPYWGSFADKGCQVSGKKRFEAPLYNLIEGDDWFGMCGSTPAEIRGEVYARPSSCDYRHGRGGMTGIWDIDDQNCH